MMLGSQQGLVFLCLYMGYTFYTLNRKSFTFVIPQITATGDISLTDAGKVLSSFSIAYTIGKFVAGVFVDRFSPTLMFIGGLLSCGIINLLFAFATPDYFVLLWFVNGICQGPGWPACGKLLKSWFSASKLGRMWSILSTCMNVAASAGPLFATWCMSSKADSEWRIIMEVFGLSSILLSALAYYSMSDKPEGDENLKKTDSSKLESGGETSSKVDNVWSAILSSPYIYVLGAAYFNSLFLKGALTDWGSSYLIQEKSASSVSAGKILAIIEVGGMAGRISSGFVGDWLVSRTKRGGGGKRFDAGEQVGHPRHLVVISAQLVLFSLLFLLRTHVTDMRVQMHSAVTACFLIGFCLYATITVVGLMSIEMSAPSVSGTSHSLVALLGNLGLIMSGYPFSYLASKLSWSYGFQLAEYLTASTLLLFIYFQWKPCYIGNKPKIV